MKLKIKLLVTATAVITINKCASNAGGTETALFLDFLDGDCDSFGQTYINKNPSTIESNPGTAKAYRQPNHLTKNPVINAAVAIPKFPARPLIPIVKPGLETC